MRKLILILKSLLFICYTIMMTLGIENLWGRSLNFNDDLSENNSNIRSKENIATCTNGTWLGTTSTDWNDASNWCNKILPDKNMNVFIPSGGNQPIIDTSAQCNDITIDSGATLTISNTNDLTVFGNWVNNGYFIPNISTVTFEGNWQNISRPNNPIFIETFYNLILSGNGTKTINVSIQINNNLTIKNEVKCKLLSNASTAKTLTLGEYGQVSGKWGSSYSGATYKNDYFFFITSLFNLTVTDNSSIPGIWLGIYSPDWAIASNWSDNIVPTRLTDAIITATGFSPVIDCLAGCKSLFILPGSTLVIKGNNILHIAQDWNNQGIFTPNLSTVIFDGADQVIGNGPYKNLTIGGSGIKTVGEIQVPGIFSIEGDAYLSNTINYTSETILQYNCINARNIGIEWPRKLETLTSIGGVVIKNIGVISLTSTKILDTTPLTILEGATLDLDKFDLSSPGALNLQCGGKTAGSLIKGTGLLTIRGNITVNNSGNGIAPAQINCQLAAGTSTFTINDENPDAMNAADLWINKISSTNVTKSGKGTLAIKGNGLFNSLVINEGNFILPSQASLKINNSLTNTSNKPLTILSDDTGTGSLIVNGTTSGPAKIIRAMKYGFYHLVTSPLGGQTINSFLTDPVNALTIQSGQDAEADYRNMRDYNPAANNWNDFFKVGTMGTTGDIVPGKGYSIKIKKSQDHQVVFTGTLPKGDITLSGLEGGYWNCIGNPYTSAITINSSGAATTRFLENNSTNLDPAFVSIYVWDPSVSETAYQTISNTTESYKLQQGQAFMVKMKTGMSTLSFTRAMQVHDVSLELKSTENIWPTIQLMATVDTINSSTTIAFHDGMTPGLDVSYDAGLLKAESPIYLYTRLVEDYGIPFAIQALPSDQYDQLIIPVGVDCAVGGKVSFSAKGMYLPSSCRPLLQDRLTGILTDLSDKTYTTDITANTAGTGRFYLHTSYNTTSIDYTKIKHFLSAIFINHSQLKIQGKPIINATVFLTDTFGRLIISKQLKKVDENTINIPTINPGVYLLYIKDSEFTQTIKLAYSY